MEEIDFTNNLRELSPAEIEQMLQDYRETVIFGD